MNCCFCSEQERNNSIYSIGTGVFLCSHQLPIFLLRNVPAVAPTSVRVPVVVVLVSEWLKWERINNKLSLSLRRFRSLLSYNLSRRECDRNFLIGDTGGCYNIGIPVHFQPVFGCGAQGVHKGSVWTEAVLRKFMEKLELVAFRSVDPQEILVSWRSTEGAFEEEGMSHHVE